MKSSTIILALSTFFLFLLFSALFFSCNDTKQHHALSFYHKHSVPADTIPLFYDGEGNQVSVKDVQLLVKASYVIISDAEYNRLDSVFYSTHHVK